LQETVLHLFSGFKPSFCGRYLLSNHPQTLFPATVAATDINSDPVSVILMWSMSFFATTGWFHREFVAKTYSIRPVAKWLLFSCLWNYTISLSIIFNI